MIVFDKIVDPIACICRRLAHFYKHECTPCREGTGWLKQILESIEVGDADERECENFFFLLLFSFFVVLTCECQRDLVGFCFSLSL